ARGGRAHLRPDHDYSQGQLDRRRNPGRSERPNPSINVTGSVQTAYPQGRRSSRRHVRNRREAAIVNELFENFGQAIEQRLRGPAFSAFLRRFGINPIKYWLLLDLFATLSKRQEVTGSLGARGSALKVMFGIFFIISILGSVVAVFLDAPATLLL